MSTMTRFAIKAIPLMSCAAMAMTAATFAAPVVRGPVRGPVHRGAPALVHRAAGSGVTLYGGGATVPGIAFEGMQALTNNPGVSPFTKGTIFGQLLTTLDKGDALQYCQTGSGYGDGVLDGLNPPNGPCAALGASPTGFGIPSSAQSYADFSSSDAVTQTIYSQLQNGPLASRGEFVQVPYVAGSIALFYNNSDLDGAAQLTITPATLCKIADGTITNWNQIPLNPAQPTGGDYPSKPLTWVYRYDAGAATFSFGNYLSAQNPKGTAPSHCTKAQGYGLSGEYDPANNSKGARGGNGVLPAGLPEPPGFLAGNGNAGVIGCILATAGASCYHADALAPAVGDGSIGYVEAANAQSYRNPSAGQDYADLYVKGSNGNFATYDPIRNLPAAAKQITALGVNEVIAAPLSSGRPVPDVVPVTGSTGNCLGIVDPASYDNIVKGYPIIAVVYLEFTSAGNGVKVPDLQNLAQLTDATYFPKSGITSVDKDTATTGTTGFSEIKLPVNGISTIASCIGA